MKLRSPGPPRPGLPLLARGSVQQPITRSSCGWTNL